MSSGQVSEEFLITIKTFKMMLLNRSNKIGKQTRMYHLDLEQVFKQFMSYYFNQF